MDRLALSRSDNQKLTEDREVVEGYKELISRFGSLLNDKNYRVKVLSDGDNNIQAFCCYTLKDRIIYLSQIFTAPWNLKMHGENNEAHLKLVTKGCGTILIGACYMEGQKEGKEELRLKPLSGSYSFYQHLNMEEDKEKDEFFFRISDTLPKKLSGIFQ